MIEQINQDSDNFFWEYIKREVPKLVVKAPTWSIGPVVNRDEAEKLISVLTKWMLGNQPDNVLEDLEKLNNPPTVCGHHFSAGEATYTCLECAIDPTCVLCQACFRRSEHGNHEYRMHSSNGGGCCDCGDTEAWKSGACCSLHLIDNEQNTQDVRSLIGQDLRRRLQDHIYVIFKYASDTLALPKSDQVALPSLLQREEESNDSATVVYNDESHTYDYVIKKLSEACKCDNKKASDFATIIDREGRSIVIQGTTQSCNAVKQQMVKPDGYSMESRNSKPLQTYVFPINVVAHQEFSILLLSWLTTLSQRCEIIRLIVSDIFVSKETDKEECILRKLMVADGRMWKGARNSYFKLIMSTLMLNMEMKKDLSVHYTKLYAKLMEDFVDDDQELNVSIMCLSVQLFTVPSISLYLAEHEHLLEILLTSLLIACCTEVKPYENAAGHGTLTDDDQINMVLDKKKMKETLHRFANVFLDLKYALGTVPTEWTDCLKERFLKFFNLYVKMTGCFEGLDGIERKTDRHLEQEPEWQTGVTVHMRFVPVIKYMMNWCESSIDVLLKCLTLTIHRLSLYYAQTDSALIKVPYGSKEYQIVDWDITKKKVSVHYPLSRLLAALLVTTSRFDSITPDQLLSLFESPDQLLAMSDRSLRALALCAQTMASAWRRNGLALVNQVYYSHEIRCRPESFDRDLQMLQVCSALLNDSDRLFVTFLQRYNLITPGLNFDKTHIVALHEELVDLLLYVCFERYDSYIACVDFKEIARREIIHVLASGAKPHSRIYKLLPDSITDVPEWEEVLKDVAEFCPTVAVHNVAKYRLKDECVLEVNPHFYHYATPNDQTNAIDETCKRRKAAKQSHVFVPRPSPPFKNLWKKALNILCCHTFLYYVHSLLHDPVIVDEAAKSDSSDKLLEKVLYLIGSAIVEERERVKKNLSDPFNFCQRAEEENIMEAMRQSVDKPSFSNNKDMVCWIVSACDDVQQRRLGVSQDDSASHDDSFEVAPRPADDLEKARLRKKNAETTRNALLAKMRSQQQSFKAKHSVDLDSIELEQASVSALDTETEDMDSSAVDVNMQPVCFVPRLQIAAANASEVKDICILCQDSSKDIILVLAAYVQVSSVLSKDRSSSKPFEVDACVDITNRNGVHVSTCSHAMHFSCWTEYYEHQKKQYQYRSQRRLHNRYDIDKNEYDCPLCRRLSNCIIPVVSQHCITKVRGLLNAPPTFPTVSSSNEPNLQSEQMLNSMEFLNRLDDTTASASFSAEENEAANNLLLLREDWVDASDTIPPASSPAPPAILPAAVEEPVVLMEVGGDDFEDILPPRPARTSTTKMNYKTSIKLAFEEMEKCFNSACLGLKPTDPIALQQDKCLLVWRSIAYTVQSLEMISRFKKEPIMQDPTIRDQKTLTGITRSAFLKSRLDQVSKSKREKMMRLLVGESDGETVLLTTNIFSSMVNLMFAADSLLAANKSKKESERSTRAIQNDRNILHLCTVAQIAQIMLFIDVNEITTSDAICDSDLIRALNQIRSYAHFEPLTNVDDLKLEACVKESFAPFVRSCTLLMRYATGVEPDPILKSSDDMSVMLKYLDLPTDICDILCLSTDGNTLHPAIQKWCSHSIIVKSNSSAADTVSNPKRLFPYLSSASLLVTLENDYSDVMEKASEFKCPRFPVEDEAIHPTLCMICGVILCSQTYCCQEDVDGRSVGPSTFHSLQCSHEHGVFLRIRQCRILLLNRNRGCFRPAPYVDRHGETDIGFKRGNPLYIDMGRMKELNLLWLNHQIDDVTVRDTDSNRHFMNVGWPNM